nr:hypothetical protein Iba_chr07bCG11190 [Ipomoea batatas]GMD16509.1 hypothetical protein Iba_chr07cCG10090 [Ipomoea batatas]
MQSLVLAMLGCLWFGICCNTVRRRHRFSLTYMMKLALVEVHLECLVDSFIHTLLKLSFSGKGKSVGRRV